MPVTYVDIIYYNNSQYSRGYKGSALIYETESPEWFYIQNQYNGLNTVTLKKTGSPTTGSDIEWSGDLVTWTPVTYDANNEFLIGIPNQSQKIYFRSSTGFSSSVNDYFTFTASENHSAGGDIRTLINYSNTSLNTAQEQCFRLLFSNDTKLTDASGIDLSKITRLASNCYYGMFDGCTGLLEAPYSLPATTIATGCYRFMFCNCTSLTKAPPSLPATTLYNSCYRSMFSGCSSLTQAPEIHASAIAGSSLSEMFYNCSSLNEIRCYATSWNTGYASNWVSGVAASGTFYNFGGATIPTGTSGIPSGWVALDKEYFQITNEYNGNNTIKFGRESDPGSSSGQIGITLEYSTDGGSTWSSFSIGGRQVTTVTVATIPAGGTILFRGNNTYINKAGSLRFSSTQNFSVSGNIMTLLDKTGQSVTLSVAGFRELFSGSKVTDASKLKLPATTLVPNCYQLMFMNCTSLVNAPALPATTLAEACYNTMFQGCTALTKAPELPATTLANSCYGAMFVNCTSLVTPPSILPATSVLDTYSCYSQMFSGCTSLTTSPYIASEDLASNCYYAMFNGCTSLNKIVVAATWWYAGYANYWVSGVAATGDFYNLGGATIPTNSTSGIPSGWTEHTTL